MEVRNFKTYAIGDIHGAYKALIQCFERSGFDRESDRLIVLGDVCDGYSEVQQCIDELLEVNASQSEQVFLDELEDLTKLISQGRRRIFFYICGNFRIMSKLISLLKAS